MKAKRAKLIAQHNKNSLRRMFASEIIDILIVKQKKK